MGGIAVVGGGPAGMLAAYAAASSGAPVTLFEQNEKLGKKLFLTGKGRCNITNAREIEDFFGQIPTNPKFLYSALYTLSNDALVQLLQDHGLRTKEERGGRIFPQSDKSSDVIRILEKMLQETNVQVRLGQRVENLWIEDNRIAGLQLAGRRMAFNAVILATGGLSYPSTGSRGDGYRMAKAVGHDVVTTVPSLIPLVVREVEQAKALQGLSLKNVRLTLLKNGKKRYQEQGEMLFTHFGISGPLVLSASAHIPAKEDFQGLIVSIDLKPALTEEQLDNRILRDFEANINKKLGNALFGLFPKKLVPIILRQAKLDGEKNVHEVTREERSRLAAVTKACNWQIVGRRGIEEAIITRGGVNVREIQPSSMESRRISGLFFAGELLDVDAYTGGYNLQIAFSTGYLAGLAAKETLKLL